MSFSLLCRCSCTDDQLEPDLLPEEESVPEPPAPPPRDTGIISYDSDLAIPLIGPALHTGDVFVWVAKSTLNFKNATLSLHCNGLSIEFADGGEQTALAWSPFTLVQACRLDSPQADDTFSWLRLFKVSIFQHGVTHFFALRGDDADTERSRWVADISRSVRELTQSLFPRFVIRVQPLPAAPWTNNRLLAGYMVLCDDEGVSVVYVELSAPIDNTAEFVVYEDESCDSRILMLEIDKHTCVSERVGVDCSCFCFDGHHFTARSSTEKNLWLRAISNVKVKLRHHAPNPTPIELKHYRRSIRKSAHRVQCLSDASDAPKHAILPRREQTDAQDSASTSKGPGPTGDGSCPAADQSATDTGIESPSVWSRTVVDAEIPLDIHEGAMARLQAIQEWNKDSARGPQDRCDSAMPSPKCDTTQTGADGAAGPPSRMPWRATPRSLPTMPRQPQEDDILGMDAVGCDDAAGPP